MPTVKPPIPASDKGFVPLFKPEGFQIDRIGTDGQCGAHEALVTEPVSQVNRWAAVFAIVLAVGLFSGCKSTVNPGATAKPERVTGVGLFLVRDEASGEFFLRRTFPDSPAARANLPLNKILYRVNGVFVQPLKIQEVSKLVQGPEGTRVFLEFVDPVTRQMTVWTITRATFANTLR